ncbi:NAD-dependent epimerase/dehydratase family protein [Deinococcus cellulosilyticus]|uniref:Epimerase n=1 Tax=Deinococcus cellulosilyticus (strain DSM 18568 / NBRC 106333 / KACC 11606 / 5516J-15) TaxID=1223518 RepID=A0A511N3Y2_DEIC1|nr:NAD-dependent epimerase/dehydratase family protein [Deinococcus cellulosilyticus]GEM47589.1 epimerase [Deinococcus cellulosilyticus NBRC 106333 = KACC 11606]
MKHALVTGGAGFIGSHLVDRLLQEGWKVTTIDNFEPFYDPKIKRDNVRQQLKHPNFRLLELDIRDAAGLEDALTDQYDVIVHLAAKAGVRPSIQDPIAYQETNVRGTQNLLELAKKLGVKQFVFASSSSVYGVNPNVPWNEDDHVLLPISPYASTKVSGELLGHVYSHLYGIRFIGLRFFTVYGPRQRPDLAIHKFFKKVLKGEAIDVFGDGSTRRDYTFIDDIVAGIRGAMAYQDTDYAIFNLGNNETVTLSDLIQKIGEIAGQEVKINRLPDQPGDVPQTWANVQLANQKLQFSPQVSIDDGLRSFHDWLTRTPV